MRDPGGKALTVFATLTVLFWISRGVFPGLLPPLAPMPDFGAIFPEVSPKVRALSGDQQTHSEMIAALRASALVLVVVRWVFIGAGITAGALLLLRRRVGRWLALALGAWLLCWAIIDRAQLVVKFGWKASVHTWTLLAHMSPARFGAAILEIGFSALTLVYLSRRSVAQNFGRAPPGSAQE